jgi:UDP-2,3-diacylglucosamine hydrolase
MKRIGLIAGNGKLPWFFAESAKRQGFEVIAIGLINECDAALASQVSAFHWVHVGQLSRIARIFKNSDVSEAVMAGGVSKISTFTQSRPDWGMLKAITSLRSMRDDELLRAIAHYFERQGLRIVAPTDYIQSVFVRPGLLAGPPLSSTQARDVEVGKEVARVLGEVDVGQTVVVKNGNVLALEAVEGTDETIRRAGLLGGRGSVVVKRLKPKQDRRFDLPAVGPVTLEVMREAGATVLALQAHHTIVLEAELLFVSAKRLGISVLAYE